MENELRDRLMKLHQERLEQALSVMESEVTVDFKFTKEELEDLCEFMDSFLYD